jgi:RNA polymerase sigma factor (sigma-70 family)
MLLQPDALVQVLLRERLRLTAIATAIIRDVHSADDIFQQVVLCALETRSGFHDSDHLLAWAFRATRHRAIDIARRRQLVSLPDEVLDLLESHWVEPNAVSNPHLLVEVLQRCLDKLTPHARELIRFRYDEGMSAVAIANRLSRTQDSVYQNLSRIHRALRSCVEQESCSKEVLIEREVSQ